MRRPLARQDGAGQRVGRRLVDQLQRLVATRRRGRRSTVTTGPKISSLHQRRRRDRSLRTSVGSTNQPCASFEPPPARISCVASLAACDLDSRRCASKARSSMTAPMKFAEVGDVADLDARRSAPTMRSCTAVPQRLGDVGARRGRALLALVLVGAAHERGRERVGVGRRVREDEVLAAGLADDARVGAVARRCSRRRSRQMSWKTSVEPVKCTPAKSRWVEAGVARWPAAVAGDEVDDAVGQAGRLQQLASMRCAETHRGARPASTRRCCPSAPAPSAGCRRWP